MSYTHLHDRQLYEDMYDHYTDEGARSDLKYFGSFYGKWFEILPDEKPDSPRSGLYLNMIYMQMVGNQLLDRYDKREARILDMMAKDEAKDEQLARARLIHEPVCEHCGKTGLRITSKDLMHRSHTAKWDDPEAVLFMLRCPHCDKNSAYWEDGSRWEHPKTHCTKCQTVMDKKDIRRGLIITTIYTCPSCGHSYKDKLDLTTKDEEPEPDPDFEKDKYMYCFHDQKSLQDHRDAKRRFEGMAQLGKQFKEREANKEVYDAVAALKKVNIGQLSETLQPAIEKAGYSELTIDKPEIGKDVYVVFSCLDSKSDRGDYDSHNTLKKTVTKALADTNWRLMSDGIHYRLGYLSGRLRAYEREEDLKVLVTKNRNTKKSKGSNE